KTELIISIISIVAFILFFFDLSGAAILMTLSVLVLSIIYFLGGLFVFNNISLKAAFKEKAIKNIDTYKIIGSIMIGLGTSALLVYILFYLLHWPFTKTEIYISIFLSIVGLVIFNKKNTSKTLVRKSLTRVIIILAFACMPLFVSSYQFASLKYRNHPDYLSALKAYIENQDDQELREKLENERLKMRYGDDWEKVKQYRQDEK
ncbi:MAG: hypothetical protein WD607_10850, partial [Candidatus Paceibacterota bacterium]